MPKLPAVECRICNAGGGFGRGVESFVGFGLPVGCGVVLGAEIKGLCRRVAADFRRRMGGGLGFGLRLG